MNEQEDTIYQSFINSELSIPYENQLQFDQCQQCLQLQEYVYKLEQEVSDLNRQLQQQKPRQQQIIQRPKKLGFCKLQNVVVKSSHHYLTKSLHEEPLKKTGTSSFGHQKKKIFDDSNIDEKTSTKALQFYKI